VNEAVEIEVKAFNEDGNEITTGSASFLNLRYEGAVPTSGIEVDQTGKITGRVPGSYRIIVNWFDAETNQFATKFLPAKVKHGNPASIEVRKLSGKILTGSVVPFEVAVLDEYGFEMQAGDIEFRSTDPSIADVDDLNNFYAKKAGSVDLEASIGQLKIAVPVEIIPNPVTEIQMSADESTIRTGDVLQFNAEAWDRAGNVVQNVPFYFAVSGLEGEKGSGASAMIDQDGRFVAEKPGVYSVMVRSGNQSAVKTVEVVPRGVAREIEMVGHGRINNTHTSDFWVWEGVDGRDYAVTGTDFGEGKAYFWDVTDPSNLIRIDSVQVDARNVNDVKVSKDGRICVISREGASSRKNGIFILDVSNPRDVQTLSTYTEGLTGGVHNLFIYEDHVYALSNGQRYDIINISDPGNPHKVGQFEIDNPARSIHDVWIEDGIAFSSNWNDGVILVDVGNGVKGGSPSNPVEIARARTVGDATHTAFPFRNEETGKFYVIAGDEIFPTFFFTKPNADMDPFNPDGYLHFIDFTDPENPKEVARYEVPEAGSHNFWVKDDVLYIGYYNGGLRVVDISGDLMGDLYKQGREIGSFIPKDPQGYVPNHAMTWGAQPHKGHIFFTDFNSGFWSAKVTELKN
jgi:hypothetical protein